MTDKKEQLLYRFQYYEPDDNETYVDWVWLDPLDLFDYKSEYANTKVRLATEDEVDLYEEAYADGYGMAAMVEFESKYDGVTFRIELNKDGNLDFEGTKMFQCAVCDKHKDFDTEVGTAGGLFLGEVKDDKLWHVCYDCAENAAMLTAIENSVNDSESES